MPLSVTHQSPQRGWFGFRAGGPGLANPPGMLDLYVFAPARRVGRHLT